MAHNININQFGRASFASAREMAWHGLGTITDGAMTSEEALELAGLNYEVKKAPAYAALPTTYVSPEGKMEDTVIMEPVEGTFITYRTDTKETFGPVGKKYTVVQNAEAFNFFDAIVGRGEAIYETAGALGKGESVFITAKLPDHISVPGELIEKYIMLSLTHDAKSSIIGGFTPVRVVCNNTLNYAMGYNGKKLLNRVSIRHTASAHDKLNEAHKLMGIANQLTNELGQVWTFMKKKTIKDIQVQDLFKSLVLTQEEMDEKTGISAQKANQLNDMWKFYNIGVGQEGIIGTAFGAYNAVSGYYQNVKASSNPEGLLKSNMFGGNAMQVSKAMDLLSI